MMLALVIPQLSDQQLLPALQHSALKLRGSSLQRNSGTAACQVASCSSPPPSGASRARTAVSGSRSCAPLVLTVTVTAASIGRGSLRKHHAKKQLHRVLGSTCLHAYSPSVAVIGAGPAGLATALALRKEAGIEDVQIFERRSELGSDIGGGVQLHSGAALLNSLGVPVQQVGNPLRRVRGISASGDQLLQLDLSALAGSLRPLTDSVWLDNGELASCTIMRDALLETMTSKLPKDSIRFGHTLESVQLTDEAAVCKFSSQGEAKEFDLVIAADGIGTVARQVVLEMSAPEQPRYTGFRIAYGVRAAGGRPAESLEEATQHFGEDLYALTASYGGRGGKLFEMLALVFRDPSPTGENIEWEPEDLREKCLQRLEKAGLTGEPARVAEGCDRFFELGVCEHPVGLEPWHRGRLVLVGDSAHAMPPFLGQGANQAIQDAVCLARGLKRSGFSSRRLSPSELQEAFQSYEWSRQIPVGLLSLESTFVGQLETLPGSIGGSVRNNLFRLFGDSGIAGLVFLNGAIARCG